MKKKKTAPDGILTPLFMSKDEFALAMRRLIKNGDFQLLRSHWANMRFDLLEAGKIKPAAEQWHVLRGFDAAIMEPEKWVEYKRRGKDQPDVPTQDLEGGE